MRIDKLTTLLQQAIADAQSLANTADHPYIEPPHLVQALLNQDDGPRSLLQRAGVSLRALEEATDAALARIAKVEGAQLQPGRDLMALLQAAEKEATKRGDQYIATEMVLLALSDAKSDYGNAVRACGLTRKALEAAVDAVRGGQKVDNAEAEGQREALKKYTLDLTERARAGKLDPVIGRDDEIRRAIQVLQRRSKNNPVLIGEPGVGKTAIVEGLAQRAGAAGRLCPGAARQGYQLRRCAAGHGRPAGAQSLCQCHGLPALRGLFRRGGLRHTQGAAGGPRRHGGNSGIPQPGGGRGPVEAQRRAVVPLMCRGSGR